MADYKRKHWLAIRDSGSLGQCLRKRGRFIHVSKLLEVVFAEQIGGDARLFGAIEYMGVSPVRGKTLNIGRNAAKRARKLGARKSWRPVPKVGA